MVMTTKINRYISINHLDPNAISENTGIAVELLNNNPFRAFDATELLVVCNYLKIKPEEIAKDDSLSM